MPGYNVTATLSAKDKSFSSTMEKASKAAGNLEEQVEKTSSRVADIAKGTVAGNVVVKMFNAITSSAGSAIKRLDALNNYPEVMQSLGYSAEDAKSSVDKLSAGIEGLPTTLDDISSSAQMLTASIGDLEKGTDTAVALNDMFLAGGQGAEAASRALTQYNQILAKGKVDQESWNTLVEVAPGQMNQLAQSLLGATANQKDLYAALQEGTVSVDDMNNAVIRLDQEGGEGFSSFAEQAKAATGGIGTAWTNVQSAVTKGVANLISSIDQAAAAADLPTISESLNMLKDGVNAFFGVLSNVASGIVTAVAPAIKFLGDNIENVAVSVGSIVAGITAVKIVNKVTSWIDRCKKTIQDTQPEIKKLNTAVEDSKVVNKAWAEASKLQNTALEASNRAIKERKDASKLAEKAEKASSKAMEAGNKSITLNTRALELKKKADEKAAKAAEAETAAEKANAAAKKASANATQLEGAATSMSNVQLSAKQVLLGVLTGKISAATAVQYAWNAAMRANPIGVVITLISGLISVISMLSGALSGETEEMKAAREEQEAFMDTCKETSDSVKKSSEEIEAQAKASDESAAKTEALADEVIELSKANLDNEASEGALKSAVNELNARVEDLNLTYDEETKQLNMTEDAIRDKIDAYTDLQKAEAIQDAYNEALSKEVELNAQKEQLTAKNNRLQDELNAMREDGIVSIYEMAEAEKRLKEEGLSLNDAENLKKQLSETDEALKTNAENQTTYSDQIAAAAEEQAAREKAAQEATVQAVVDAAVQKSEALNQALATQSATLDMLSAKNQEVVATLQDTWQDYYEQATNMFDALSEEQTISVDEMIANIQKNQEVINNWGNNMQSLRDRIEAMDIAEPVKQGLIEMTDSLQAAGPEQAGYVAALVSASDEQLQSLGTSWGTAGDTAWNALKTSNSRGAAENMEQVKNLVTELESSMSDTVANANFGEIGTDILAGIAEGLDASDEAVQAAQKKSEEIHGIGFEEPWEISSPSRVTERDGMYIDQGLGNGIERYARIPINAAIKVAKDVMSHMKSTLSAMNSVGIFAMQGFVRGMNAMRSSVISTASSIANAASGTISKALQIGSPSRLLEKFGIWTGEGYDIGLAKMIRPIGKTVNKIIEPLTGLKSITVGDFDRISSFKVGGALAFAGGYSFVVDGFREDINDLAESIRNRPIVLNNDLSIDGRSFAKSTVTYINEEQESQMRFSNNRKGVR